MRSLIGFSVVASLLLVVGGLGLLRASQTHSAAPPATAPFVAGACDDVASCGLRGLWSRHPDSSREDDPVAFYYFHERGLGLYRYGQIGHNTTNSYTWHVDDTAEGSVLELRFTKTGVVQRVPFRVDHEGRPTLVLAVDPKQPGVKEARYAFVPPPALGTVAPDLVDDAPEVSTVDARIDHRLWIDEVKFATGGMGFRLYQLRAAGIDGRGTGWFHVGDYDDWSTESLGYRLLRGADGGIDRLDLQFPLANTRHTTALSLFAVDDGRVLRLSSDPRDFNASHDYKDGGPSFAALIAEH